jgi:glycosyltransferase involved in cell wall biosynthesis
MDKTRIAVLIPCYNESATITTVINDFQQQLPAAVIYVYDNGSADNSLAIAKDAGATVKHVGLRGKGQVVRRMFADINADLYVMVDGDATYDASSIHQAIELMHTNMLDMVVCTRKPASAKSFRRGHTLGNKCFTYMVDFLFGKQFNDIFSGYRVFSRRFVKSFPAISQGFETEAEITIHALQLGIPAAEIETPYHERPPGSSSKLNTIRDGWRIMREVLLLFVYIRPMTFFGVIFLLFAALSGILGFPLILNYLHTGLVPRFPTAILAAGLGMIATLSLAVGIVLDSVSRTRLEVKRCWYLLAANNSYR